MMRGNRDRRRTRSFAFLLALATNLVSTALGADPPSAAQKAEKRESERPAPQNERLKLLPEQRKVLDRLVDKGLAFLASRQNEDGSFPTQAGAEPAVTSLCVMAFLSRGHRPGEGSYGDCLDRGIDYVLGVQDATSGAIFPRNARQQALRGNYNHAISGLMLCDAYAKMDVQYRENEANARRRDRVEEAIQKALLYAGREQKRPKHQAGARGGFRYLARVTQNDADISVTAWMVMFYTAAAEDGLRAAEKRHGGRDPFHPSHVRQKTKGFRLRALGRRAVLQPGDRRSRHSLSAFGRRVVQPNDHAVGRMDSQELLRAVQPLKASRGPLPLQRVLLQPGDVLVGRIRISRNSTPSF